MKKEITDRLIRRYMNNKCTPEEIERVENWLADPENRADADQVMRSQWESSGAIGSESEPDPYLLLGRIHESIHIKQGNVSESKRRPRHAYQWLKVAAVIVLPILFTGLYYNFKRSVKTTTPVALSMVENEPGQRSRVRLPDGSVVWLNAESKLQFPEKFENHSREVLLEGEAFFEVIKDPDLPFIVKTGTIDVTVLGTSFNVNAFPESNLVETTLVTGKVALKKANSNEDFLMLEPNQKASYSKEIQSFTIRDVDPVLSTSWKDGRLIFRDTPFHEVIKKLERWYGVEITWSNNLEDDNMTFTVQEESLERILDLMSTLIPIQYTIEDKTVKIKRQ